MKWDPQTFKMRYFPNDQCDVSELAAEIEGRGNVHFYKIDGVEHAYLPNFKAHQVINNRERESILPPWPGEGKEGREGKGRKEGRNRVKAATFTREFEKAWAVYPATNGSRTDAFKAWEKVVTPVLNELMLDAITDAIEAQKKYKASMDRRQEFCPEFPFMQKWINGRRWENQTLEVPGVHGTDAERTPGRHDDVVT